MTDAAPQTEASTAILGPFLGQVTADSVKIWLHLEGQVNKVYVTVHPDKLEAAAVASETPVLAPEKLFTDCVVIRGLQPDTMYFYKLWTNAAHALPLNLEGLRENELHFRTLPADLDEQIDFLIMSCHNPTVATQDGFDGHAVWADIPQIIARESNKNVRFALLVGDQVYADDWEAQTLKAESEDARRRLYLAAYRTFWSNKHYRRVMCSLPAVMMWDDHDITDGWGSRKDSFVGDTSDFKPEWRRLFSTASEVFSVMQASRNPEPLSKTVTPSTAASE
jgi:alkaline phosphatase D